MFRRRSQAKCSPPEVAARFGRAMPRDSHESQFHDCAHSRVIAADWKYWCRQSAAPGPPRPAESAVLGESIQKAARVTAPPRCPSPCRTPDSSPLSPPLEHQFAPALVETSRRALTARPPANIDQL